MPDGKRKPRSREAAEPVPTKRFVLVLLTGLVAVGCIVYGLSFRSSFAYDDIDHINLAADALSGKVGFWAYLFRPHLEHVVPLLRLAFLANAWLFGADALWFRLALFLFHVGSGLCLGLLSRRTARSDVAGYAVGIAYVASGGLSSMMVWFPSGLCVTMGLFGLHTAYLAVACRDRLGAGRAQVLAAAGLLWTVLCESTLLGLLIGPALLDEVERRKEGRRGRVGALSAFSVVLIGVAAAVTRALYMRTSGQPIHLDLFRGLKRAVGLIAVSPYRFVFPGTSLPRAPGDGDVFPVVAFLFGVVVLMTLIALAVAASTRTESKRLVGVSAIVALGPLVTLGLAAVGRSRLSYYELYDADRYFFPLAAPAALWIGIVAVLAVRLWKELPDRQRAVLGAALVVVSVAELSLHARAAWRRCPLEVYAAHGKRFGEIQLLAGLLTEAADRLPPGSSPLQVPDANLTFADVHNRRLSTRVLLFVTGSPSPRLRLGESRVSERDQEILNPVLDEWARVAGYGVPAWTVRNGVLVNVKESGRVDFRTEAGDEAVVSGLFGWEGAYRWMSRVGELRLRIDSSRLRLTLGGVSPEIVTKAGAGAPAGVTVEVVDESTGEATPVGRIDSLREGDQSIELQVPAGFFGSHSGRTVKLRLTGDWTWRPVDVLPGNGDTRELSVRVVEAAFVP